MTGKGPMTPKDLAEAMSRPIPDAEARRCFACHNTASTAAGVFDTKGLIPGITCEACHGPGRRQQDAGVPAVLVIYGAHVDCPQQVG